MKDLTYLDTLGSLVVLPSFYCANLMPFERIHQYVRYE